MNTGMPAAMLSVLVQAKGITQTNAQLARTQGVLSAAGGAAVRMGQQLAKAAKYGSLALAAGIGVAVKKAIDFDKEMRNVNSIAQLSEKKLGRVRDKVLELAGKTAQAPVTLAAGMYDLVSSGFDANESLQILSKSARAATAGLTTTEVSTKAVAAVLNAYRLKAGQAGDVSDVLFEIVNRGVITFEELAQNIGDVLPFSASLGINLREVGASVATMTKAGISAPETMTRIKSVMVSLLKPSKALNDVIHESGFASGDAMVKALGFQGTLDKIAKSAGGSKTVMAAMFPNIRALGGALALTGDNAKRAGEDLKGMQDASGATAKALSQQEKSTAFIFQRLKAQVEAAAISFGEKLLPEINKVGEVLSDPKLSAEEKFTRVFDILVQGASKSLDTAVSLAEQYGPKIVAKLASSIATAWWHLDVFGKILGAAALIRVLGGPGALTATGKTIGRQLGLGVSQGMATTVAVDTLPTAAATMSGSRWLGTDSSKQRSALQGAGQRSVLGQSEAEALAAQGGIFAKSERNLVARFKGLGSRLARGVATWGLGGLIVGGITKELVHGNTGQRIGSAMEAAGVGAAIGTAIAPGVGTALGAAGGVIASQIKDQISGPSTGDEFALQFAEGFESAIGPRLQKAMSGKDLGALGGLSKQIRRSIRMAVAEGAGPEALQPLRAQLKQVLSARDFIQKPREEVSREIDLLRSGIATRMGDISEIFHNNIQGIDQAWVHGGDQWRQASAENMKAAVAAIRSGMNQGVIETQVGQSRIKELMRSLKIVEGRDPYGIAEGFAQSWKQAGRINNSQIDHMLGEMRRMPKGAREAAQTAMIQMAHALESKGELVKGSASRLNSALVTKFGKTNQQIVSGVTRGADAIAGLFSSLVNNVSGYLSDLGVNVNSILKAFGVSKGVNFTVKVAKGAASAVTGAAKDILGAVQGKQSGGFIVPGTGSGDRPGFTGEVGAFVLNREATRAYGFNRGGNIPLALEPGERYFTRREVAAMGGTRTLEALNDSVPRFQKGGALGSPQVLGPAGPLRDLGQAAATKGYQAAQEYIKAHRPHDVVPAGGGLMAIDGKPVAEWIAKILIDARKAGVAFTVSSGFRSYAEQAAIYNSGVRPAAVPGTSHHEGKAYPDGAVDITPGAEALAAWLGHSRFASALIYAGSKDPVHFSHPYGGGYMLGGFVQALQEGGFAGSGYTVKGIPASAQQTHTAGEIQSAADKMASPHLARVASMMAATQESNMGSTGNTFQLTGDFEGVSPSDNAYTQAVQWFGKGYYEGGGNELARKYNSPGKIAQAVEGSAYPGAYSQWKAEGQKWTDGWANSGSSPGLTEGQKKLAEGKQRKANNERHLKALEQEVAQAHSPIAKQSKLWRLIKFWGRTGIFEQDEKQHIIEAVQNAAAQTKPSSAVNVLSHLSDYAKGHGEITGQDPSNFRDMEKAIERAQNRGQEERKKAVDRQKKHVETVHNRVASKIANRAAFPELVAQLAHLRRGADVGEEYASQLVTLEPENISDAYVDQERGAYGNELNRLLSWRNTTVRAQEVASREIANFEAQIARIEELKLSSPQDAKVFGNLLGKAGGGKQKKALGGLVQQLGAGGKAKGQDAKAFGKAIKEAGGNGGGNGSGPDAYSKTAYKIPLLQEAIGNAKTMRDETWAGELEEIQGLTGPSGILESLPSEPVAGAFGGRIFEIQNSIRELALKVSNATSGVSELKELEDRLNTDWHKRFLVSEAQRNTISQFEASYPGGRYAGTFAKGGVIGAGQWGIAGETGDPEIVQGPARVFNPSDSAEILSGGQTPTVIINGDVVQAPGDTRDPVELLIGSRKLKAHIEKTARNARATGRQTPGGR